MLLLRLRQHPIQSCSDNESSSTRLSTNGGAGSSMNECGRVQRLEATPGVRQMQPHAVQQRRAACHRWQSSFRSVHGAAESTHRSGGRTPRAAPASKPEWPARWHGWASRAACGWLQKGASWDGNRQANRAGLGRRHAVVHAMQHARHATCTPRCTCKGQQGGCRTCTCSTKLAPLFPLAHCM